MLMNTRQRPKHVRLHPCLTYPTLLALALQGSSRLQRGLLYMDYLRHWSGGTHKPQVTRVPNMGHSSPLMFTSPTFLRFIGA